MGNKQSKPEREGQRQEEEIDPNHQNVSVKKILTENATLYTHY